MPVTSRIPEARKKLETSEKLLGTRQELRSVLCAGTGQRDGGAPTEHEHCGRRTGDQHERPVRHRTIT